MKLSWTITMMNRFDIAHLEAANVYSKLSAATRAKVGCLIVKDNRIISIGYNGTPSGWDNTCENENNETKPEVLHAETNAIAKLARSTESGEGATLYCTHSPCLSCSKLIYQSGIQRVVYETSYAGKEGTEFLLMAGIIVEGLYDAIS